MSLLSKFLEIDREIEEGSFDCFINNRIQMVLLQEKIKVSALIRHYSLHMRAPSTEFISLLKG